MIVIFPMLVDGTISENVIPGVCKALEKFILIYQMEAIMKITGLKILYVGGSLATMAARTVIPKTQTEAEVPPGHPPSGTKNLQNVTPQQVYVNPNINVNVKGSGGGKNLADTAFNILKSTRDLATTNVEFPKDQSLSLEPTYTIVTTPTGTRLIGVKVIPFPVKTKKYSLPVLLCGEASLGFFTSLILRYERKVIRGFWALCRALRIPFLKSKIISGDPEKDILWASTVYKRNIFCLVNHDDMKDELFKEAGGINQLFDVGWNSFISADEINKRVIFCMKQFNGLCSSVPYSFVYSSVGKDHLKVYEKLEDIKKAANPFFKTSKSSMKKIFEEGKDVVGNYLKEVE